MTRHRLFSFAVLMMTLLGLTTGASSQLRKKPRPTIRASVTVKAPPPLAPEAQRRRDAFEKAWSTLNENYFDQTFSGLDWRKIYREFDPRVTAAKTDDQVHGLISEMIGRIGRSHFAVIPPDYFDAIKVVKAAAKERERILTSEGGTATEPAESDESDEDLLLVNPDARYGIGIDVRLIGKQLTVTRIEPGSAAEAAGIRLGYVIDKINGVSLQDLVRRITTDYARVRNLERYLPAQIVNWFLNGERDTAVFLTCLDAADTPVEFKVKRLLLGGEKISLGARFPEQFMQFETVSLSDEIGYIKFNIFSLLVISKFCDALTKFNNKSAIIIDLRGNTGGVLGTLVGLTGMMIEKPLMIGTSVYKVGSEPMLALSKTKNFKGKIVFLVDNQTVSAAEVFSAGLQENGRALVVGNRTAGEALPAVATQLATGAVLVYPIANFLTNKGKSLEGSGVEPDFTVDLDRASLLKGKDPQLEKALELIKQDASFPKAASAIVAGTSVAAVPPPPPPAKRQPQSPLTKVRKIESAETQTSKVTPSPIPAVAKDQKSLKILADFVDRVGSIEAFRKLTSYLAIGKATISLRGTETATELIAARQFPDKYALALTVDAVGNIREIYNGETAFLQTDYGLDRDLSADSNLARSDLFSSVVNVIDPTYFKALAYKGAFDIDGGKKHVIEATMQDGALAGLAFDAQTGMLVTFVSQGAAHNFSDYRKVGGLSLPFSLDMSGVMKIKLDSVKINETIDKSYFEKKQFCFDIVQ